MSLISKFYKTLPILGLATLSVLSSMSISSCSDKDPTDYVGNANGTD
jgi:hypothetical protein